MGVALVRLDTGMAEQLLQHAQVGTAQVYVGSRGTFGNCRVTILSARSDLIPVDGVSRLPERERSSHDHSRSHYRRARQSGSPDPAPPAMCLRRGEHEAIGGATREALDHSGVDASLQSRHGSTLSGEPTPERAATSGHSAGQAI
jgi:hypothetical protein